MSDKNYKVKNGNSCIGCQKIGEFPIGCEGCGNLITNDSKSAVDAIVIKADPQAVLLAEGLE